jgi:hypothetical protein
MHMLANLTDGVTLADKNVKKRFAGLIIIIFLLLYECFYFGFILL